MDKLIQQEINKGINHLPKYHQLAFAVMLSERFLPTYFAFHLTEKWGNPMILLNGIDLLKSIIRQQDFDPIELELIDELIEDATPDMDDFPSNILASFALDISSMLYECFAFARNQKTKHIENCSKMSIGALEMFVQKKDKLKHDLSVKELNQHFANNDLIKGEIDYQLNLLNELQTNTVINNRLYIEKTIKSPNIAFEAMPFVQPAG